MATGTLTGQTIANTYKGLLRVASGSTADNTILDADLQIIEDGDGTDSCLQLSTDSMLIKDASGTDVASCFEVQDKDATVCLSVNGTNNRVGIGTATPQKGLDVAGAIGIVEGNTIDFHAAGTTSNSGRIYCTSSDIMTFHNTSDNTKRMSIIADGKVGIGSHTPVSKLDVRDDPGDNGTLATFHYTRTTAADNDDTILDLVFSGDASPGLADYISFQDSNSTNGLVTDDDDGTVTYNDTSDYRIKTNIELIDSALLNINKLKPSSFNIRERTKKAYGFIAHELQEVYPSMVTGEKDAVDADGEMKVQMVSKIKLIPFMVKAIQELSAKVTALENA